MERNAEASARLKARIAGGLWLIVMVTGGFAAYASSALIADDPATTAANIAGSERLFRLGFAANLAAGVCYIGVTVILYDLLKAVNRTLSLFAAFLGLAGSVAGAAISIALLVPLVVVRVAQYSSVLNTAQLQALAFLSLKLNGQGFNISMLFFGVQCITVGYLIMRSSFLPRILGALLAIGGSSYVISSFANFVAPPLGSRLSPFVIPAAVVGEGSLCLWLLVIGLNLKKWEEQSSHALPEKASASSAG